jgi:hypothetical protein
MLAVAHYLIRCTYDAAPVSTMLNRTFEKDLRRNMIDHVYGFGLTTEVVTFHNSSS